MATGGFKANPTTDFLEEWKAKREKMRAKMLGDIAAATGACTGNVAANASPGTNSNTSSARNAAPSTELSNNGNSEHGGSTSINSGSALPMARSSSFTALKRPEDDTQPTPTARGADNPGSYLKKTPQSEKLPCAAQDYTPTACNDSDKDSPSPSKGKEKKSTGPSARKGKGQIEKRKLREKRRSTGVVSIPSNESLDELEDDDGGEKERKQEEQLTQLNTEQNETMALEAEADLLQELARERQENNRLLKAHQDKDDLIDKLREEIDLLNRDLDDIEDESEQLKQENKTLLKVVGQLTR
ncbi:PRKC apoptosis WT1 regulator protein [Aplochiton taeniatus]